MKPTRTCAIEDCKREYYSVGYCRMHYKRLRAHGDAAWEPPAVPEVCSIEGCTKPHLARGWCSAHWTRWKRHGDPLAGGVERETMPDECTVPECGNVPFARGLCATHWRRRRREDDPAWAERMRATRRDWHAANPDKVRETRRASREKHLADAIERSRAWRAENRDLVLRNNWLRRRRAYGLPPNLVDVVDPMRVFERDSGVCQLCLEAVDPNVPWPDPASPTIDHTIPATLHESAHSYENTVLAHWDCNRRKAARAREDAGSQ